MRLLVYFCIKESKMETYNVVLLSREEGFQIGVCLHTISYIGMENDCSPRLDLERLGLSLLLDTN